MPEQVQAHISIDVLASGRIRLSSTCKGVPDSSYTPLPDARGPAEVERLLAELRQRLEGVSQK